MSVPSFLGLSGALFSHSATICIKEIVDNSVQIHGHDALSDVPELLLESKILANSPGEDAQHDQLRDEQS
jgi:hypothetical protein